MSSLHQRRDHPIQDAIERHLGLQVGHDLRLHLGLLHEERAGGARGHRGQVHSRQGGDEEGQARVRVERVPGKALDVLKARRGGALKQHAQGTGQTAESPIRPKIADQGPGPEDRENPDGNAPSNRRSPV